MSPQGNISSFLGSAHSFEVDRKNSGKVLNPSASSHKSFNIASTIMPQSNESVIPSSQQALNTLTRGTIRPSTSYSQRPTTTATVRRAPPPKRIMAIAEGRGMAIEIGLCMFDVNSCEAVISQV